MSTSVMRGSSGPPSRSPPSSPSLARQSVWYRSWIKRLSRERIAVPLTLTHSRVFEL